MAIMKNIELKFYDQTKKNALNCDASEYGLDVTLLQDDAPIAFHHARYQRLNDSMHKSKRSIWQ